MGAENITFAVVYADKGGKITKNKGIQDDQLISLLRVDLKSSYPGTAATLIGSIWLVCIFSSSFSYFWD